MRGTEIFGHLSGCVVHMHTHRGMSLLYKTVITVNRMCTRIFCIYNRYTKLCSYADLDLKICLESYHTDILLPPRIILQLLGDILRPPLEIPELGPMTFHKNSEICARIGRLLDKIFHTTHIFASFNWERDFFKLNSILKPEWFQLPHTRRNSGGF